MPIFNGEPAGGLLTRSPIFFGVSTKGCMYPFVFVRRTPDVRILPQLLVGAAPTPPSRRAPRNDLNMTQQTSSR